MPRSSLFFLVALAAAGAALAAPCPPPALDSVKEFDLARFVNTSPWYTQEQVTVSFQRPDSFYCVRARYVPEDPADLSAGINVINYGNVGGVNRNPVGTSGAAGNTSFSQFAVVAPTSGPSRDSKLLVGPKQFVSRAPAAAIAARLGAPNGNYRVVAVGPAPDDYRWAIIVGGAASPSEATAKGCGPSKAKDEGLWLFSSQPVAPAADVALMRKKAQELGIDISRLQPVTQAGCKYEGADPPGVAAKRPAAAAPEAPAAAAANKPDGAATAASPAAPAAVPAAAATKAAPAPCQGKGKAGWLLGWLHGC